MVRSVHSIELADLPDRLPRVIGDVEAGGEWVILRDGREVARLSAQSDEGEPSVGRTAITTMRHTGHIRGDIMGPFHDEWDEAAPLDEGGTCS